MEVEIAAAVQQQIRRHARSSMSTEICGVLIGRVAEPAIVIENAIAGEGARQAGTHVTFTQDTWAHVYVVKDRDYPDKRIVGWYHSHPGFGVFLSEHDLFIHRNFFSDPSQVAWVVDPHSDEEGCFVWSHGEIRRLQTLTVRSEDRAVIGSEPHHDALETEPDGGTKDEGAIPRPKAVSGARWTLLTLSHLVLLLLGIVIGWLLFPPIVLVQSPAAAKPAAVASPAPENPKK